MKQWLKIPKKIQLQRMFPENSVIVRTSVQFNSDKYSVKILLRIYKRKEMNQSTTECYLNGNWPSVS